MNGQAAKTIRTVDRERMLDAAIAHLESVHGLIVLKQRRCRVIPFPLRRERG